MTRKRAQTKNHVGKNVTLSSVIGRMSWLIHEN